MLTGLLDSTDDVVGVAAECLSICCSSNSIKKEKQEDKPVDDSSSSVNLLVDWLSEEKFSQLLSTVWTCLDHVDDLSASTPALLSLLANLIKHGKAR